MIDFLLKLFRKSERAERYSVSWSAFFKGRPARVLNQSISGMYIEVDNGAPLGSIVKFYVAIPDLNNPANKLHMAYEGKVVRTNKIDGRLGLGIELTRPVIIEDTESPSDKLWKRVN